MEREALEQKINEELGSTRLQLSGQTMDAYYTRTLAGIKDDADVTDEFVKGEVEYLKTLNGQLHADVSKETKNLREKMAEMEKKLKGEGGEGSHGGQGGGGSNADEIAALKKLIEAMEAEAKEKDAASRRKSILDSVAEGLKAKRKKAELPVNDYFVKQALGKLELPEDGEGSTPDEDALVKQLDGLYIKELKAAGIEGRDAYPSTGRRTGKPGASAVDKFWEKKKKKEHWGESK